MNTMMKALLACMPATALADTEIIELSANNLQGSDFLVDSVDALEFYWAGPRYANAPQPKIKNAGLSPAPYSVTKLDTECKDVVTGTIPTPDKTLA